MAYQRGFCPQCDCQIMVRDSRGNLNGFKSNFRQADMLFEDGHKVRTIICEKCLEAPDFQKIIDAITCPSSAACGENTSNQIKARGLPVSMSLAIRAKQGMKFPI